MSKEITSVRNVSQMSTKYVIRNKNSQLWSTKGHIKFDDLPGMSAQEVTGGYVIYHEVSHGVSVGFYNSVQNLVTIFQIHGRTEQFHQPCTNLEQVMRFTYLKFQTPAPVEKEVTVGPDRKMTFRDMPGIVAKPLRKSFGGSLNGFDIYNEAGTHIAHYTKTNRLWLYPRLEVIDVQPFPNLMQAVRFAYLRLQELNPEQPEGGEVKYFFSTKRFLPINPSE